MDGISAAASVIQLVGVAGTLSQQLYGLLRDLRKAPAELSALSNEVTDLSVILGEVEAACAETPGPESAIGDEGIERSPSLATQLGRAQGKLAELAALVDAVSVRGTDGRHRVDRLAWVRKKSAATRLQREFRDVRNQLHLILDTTTAYVAPLGDDALVC
jgi:hypothetical protein